MARRPAYTARIPVICVGNVVAGGQGKTPTALAVCARLRALGRAPVFLTRGYGGRLKGPLVVEASHTARDVGDEPLLLAATAPCVVARDRASGARLCEGLGDVIVMDDGLQNPSLAKTLGLVVIDGASAFGNGRVIPAGPLRAPLVRQLPMAQTCIVVGEGAARLGDLGLPVLQVRVDADAGRLPSGPIVAFAGIGRPEKFFQTLHDLGRAPVETVAFPDHHAITAREASRLIERADRHGACLVTTRKDEVRLRGESAPEIEELARRTVALPIAYRFETDQIDRLLQDALSGGG